MQPTASKLSSNNVNRLTISAHYRLCQVLQTLLQVKILKKCIVSCHPTNAVKTAKDWLARETDNVNVTVITVYPSLLDGLVWHWLTGGTSGLENNFSQKKSDITMYR